MFFIRQKHQFASAKSRKDFLHALKFDADNAFVGQLTLLQANHTEWLHCLK